MKEICKLETKRAQTIRRTLTRFLGEKELCRWRELDSALMPSSSSSWSSSTSEVSTKSSTSIVCANSSRSRTRQSQNYACVTVLLMPLHLSTTLARTPYALQKQLLKLTDVYANKAHTCLFALSANFPSSQDLADTVDILTKFNKRGHTLGCLSDSFLAVDFSKSNHIWDNEKDNSKPILSCSIGLFDSSRVIPFRSTIPGKTQPQVGRWHSFRKKKDSIGDDENEYELNVRAGTDNGTVSWEDIWNRSALKNVPLPEELRSLE